MIVAIPHNVYTARGEEFHAPAIEDFKLEGFQATCFYHEEIIVAVVVWRKDIGDFNDAFYHIYEVVICGVFAAFVISNDKGYLIHSRKIPFMGRVEEVRTCTIAKPPLPKGNSAIKVVALILEMDGIACIDRDGIVAGEGCNRIKYIY